ncbi:putative ATPase [Pseudoduganella lurida]|uniref:Putative ATPase n=1 Tax=Pseudoduganella lurida TaxID=1036180 RepID=A0A562QWE0_9BURK|nr:AAA family ATPase [Pseudoduganella lurida]TWI61151.1 putative ATPase [Pseudoduganella lurida]
MSTDPSASAESAVEAAAADGRVLLDAALLKGWRKARGLSQEALAELCFHRQLCVSIASIKRAETGKAVLYRTARHLAEVYDVALEQLLPAAAASATAGAGTVIQARPAPADDPARWVILLHLELAAPPDRALAGHIATAVLQFGGRLEVHGGARQCAVFGLPQAYRSDAERALRCALELARHVAPLGGRSIALRLVRWQPDQGMEQAPVPAAAAAPAGVAQLPVHVTDNLLPQLDGKFVFAARDEHLPGWRRCMAAGDGDALPALIGRYAETRQFKALAETTLESQAGHIVYLRAMAGVGKSRLAQEFAEIARQDGIACHTCEVLDAGADDWRAPLAQLAKSLLGCDMTDAGIDAAITRLKLPADLRLFYRALCGATLAPDDAALHAAMSHGVREEGMAQALKLLVLRVALAQPLLIALEDLHWGEPNLFDALARLLEETREVPVLWVLTSRVDDDPLETALRPQLYDVALTVFDLGPMSPREAAALADQFELDAAFRRQCVERAQGNPLFLTQLLASPEHLLPDSLKHLIQARLDGLAPEQARALRMAAVFGNRFDLALLREALGDAGYEPQAGGRNSLLRPSGKGAYAFVHDLVMQCIYDAIDPAQLRRLHLAAAEVFRTRDAALCAQHLYHAHDPGALDIMLAAIRLRLEQHDYAGALELASQCNRADATTLASFPLALLRGQAAAGLGKMAEARQYYRHAMTLAGRPEERIEAVIGLATALNVLEELEEEERLLDETIPLAMSTGAEAALGRLLYLKGNIYFPRGNFGECRRYHEDAARYAQASDMAETQARALSGVGDSYYAQGRMRQAHQMFSECLAMCERHRYVHIEASNRSALGSTRIYLGEPAAAIDDAIGSALLAHKVGNRRAETFARMTAGWALVDAGRLAEAEEQVGTGLELARSIGSARFDTFLQESAARIAWLRGDQFGAERRILNAVADLEKHRLQNFIGPWLMGTLALFTHDAATRKLALLKGAAYLTRDCLAHNAYRFYLTAAEVALQDGDLVSAGFYADQLAACASEPCAWVDHHVALIRAQLQERAAPETLRTLAADGQRFGFSHTAPSLRARLLLAA